MERGGSVLPAAADGTELSSPTIKGVEEISQFTILVGTLVHKIVQTCRQMCAIKRFQHREREGTVVAAFFGYCEILL